MFTFYAVLLSVIIAVFVTLKFFKLFNLTFFVAASIIGMLLPLPTYAIVTTIARDAKQTYNEYWNGYETAAVTSVTNCERDGSCRNEYQCDSYTVVEMETYYDSDNKPHQRPVTVTKWHDCPYSQQETTYIIDTTLGDFTVAANVMTGPEYRAGKQIPGGQITQPPALWQAAAERVNSGKSGPVTQTHEYKNYILASERSLFKKYSDSIETYKESNMLPKPSTGVADLYQASKAYFVGNTGLDTTSLTSDVSYLNGALGQSLYGDLHIVFVDAQKVKDPADYSEALFAYWQSEELGRNAVAKNSITVIVGVEKYKTAKDSTAENTIKPGTPVAAWVKANTGMPLGNEEMLTQLESELRNEPVDENFIGHPSYDSKTDTVASTKGAVENILFGDNKFSRVSMTSDDDDDNGSGFSYLKDEWTPDDGVMATVYIFSSIFFALGFALMLFLGYNLNKDPVKEFFTPNK